MSGDVVAFSIRCSTSNQEVGWVVGRVILTDACPSEFKDVWASCVLLYLLPLCVTDPIPPPRPLLASNLLCPPMIVQPTIWTSGYARRVEQRPFERGERLATHCFYSPVSTPTKWFDEHANPLDRRREPCGMQELVLIEGVAGAIGDWLRATGRLST